MHYERIKENYDIPIFNTHHIAADIYSGHSDASNRPCILFLHGGGFVGGDKEQFSGLAAYLSLKLNAVCVSINYRTAPQNQFPAPIIDCLGVCRWLEINKHDLGIDPARLYLAGGSPGANIAAMTMIKGRAILDDAGIPEVADIPKKGILLNPILDMESFYLTNSCEKVRVDQYLGADSTSRRRKSSPVLFPQAGLSFLLLLGEEDRVVGLQPALHMKEAFEKAGSSIEIATFPGEAHGWFNQAEKMVAVACRMEQFIMETEGK